MTLQSSTSQYDDELGLLSLENGQWMLERRAFLGDRTVPICIEFEAGQVGELSPLQRQALRRALSLPPNILRLAAPVVLQNYEVYREAIGDEEMPPLADPIEVWDQVTFSYLFVPPHADYSLETPSFMLLTECSWDPEHGLEVRFRNGVADAASQQGELGWDD